MAGAAGLAAVDARADVLAGREHAQAGLSAARDGELEAAQAAFAEAEARFAVADDRLSSPFVAVAERTIPGVAQNLRAAGALIDSGRDLAVTAVAVADRAGAEDLQVVDGRVPIEAAAEVGEELAEARAVLATTQDRLGDIDSPWLVDEAREASVSLATQVADADASIEVAAETTRLLPGLLGGDGSRRWFVAVLSTSELRGAGGLLGNYAVLTADDGEVALERSGAIAELNASTDQDGVEDALPAVYRELYSSWSPERFWQNLSVTPDFPTMGEAVTTVAPRSDAGPVDGVIGIDPLGLAALVELTGPVTVPSWPEPLGPDEIVEVLLFEQYRTFTDDAALDAFQTDVVEAVVDALTAGSLPPPSSLLATLAPAVAGGHLRLFSTVEDEQGLFDRIGLTGALEAPGTGDYFQLVSQNGSESKIDHFLRRAVDYAVEVDPVTGAASATATVTLTNLAPDSGLDGYIIGGRNAESVTTAGEMRCFTTVLTPLVVVGVSIDGGPEQPVQLGSEQGLFSGTVLHRIPSGATSTLVFRLEGELVPRQHLRAGRRPPAHRPRRRADGPGGRRARRPGPGGTRGAQLPDGVNFAPSWADHSPRATLLGSRTIGGSEVVKSLCRVAAVAAALMAVAVGALAFVGASASAQEYTPRCVVAVVYNQETGILRVIGTGLQAGFTTPILLDGEEIGEATADGAGDFLIEIAVQLDGPANQVFVVSIQCSGDGDVSTTQLTAPPTTTTTTQAARPPPPGGSNHHAGRLDHHDPHVLWRALSRTGTESVPLAVAGVTAVGLGSLAVLFARRRRHDTA